MIFHLIRLKCKIFNYNKQNRLFLTSIIILISSLMLNACSELQQKSYEQGARFITQNSNNFIQKKFNNKIQLSSSYIENEKKICIYISDKSKIITETSKSLNCPSEI